MNTAYKHLEAKLRIGELTIGQWIAIILGFLLAMLWATTLSPLSSTLTLFTAVYAGGIPALIVFMATATDFDLLLLIRSAMAWRRREGRHLPGPGSRTKGYLLRAETDPRGVAMNGDVRALDMAALWDS